MNSDELSHRLDLLAERHRGGALSDEGYARARAELLARPVDRGQLRETRVMPAVELPAAESHTAESHTAGPHTAALPVTGPRDPADPARARRRLATPAVIVVAVLVLLLLVVAVALGT